MKNVKKGGKCEFAAHRMNDQYTQEVDQSACSASTHFAQKNGYSVGGHGSAVVAKRLSLEDVYTWETTPQSSSSQFRNNDRILLIRRVNFLFGI